MIGARVFCISTTALQRSSIFFFPKIPTRPVFRLLSPAIVAMSTTSKSQEELDSIFKQKRVVRSTVRKSLKAMDPSLRTQQGSIFFSCFHFSCSIFETNLGLHLIVDESIQKTVLEAPWFKSCKRLCAYISCKSLNEVDTSKILSEILQHPGTSLFEISFRVMRLI